MMTARQLGMVTILGWLAATTANGRDESAFGWRRDGSGTFDASHPPRHWSPTSNVVWKTPMPSWSNGSPALRGDRIFVTAEPDRLLCLDRATGTILWTVATPGGKSGGHSETGGTTATPAVGADGRVYTFCGTGIVAAHDRDGGRLWSRTLPLGGSAWGHCSSPLLSGDILVVAHGDVSGLNAETGEPVWTVTSPSRHGSTVAVRLGDTAAVLTASGLLLAVADGRTVGSGLGTLNYNAPVVLDGVAYVAGVDDQHASAWTLNADAAPEKRWQTPVKQGRYYASPILCNGRLFALRQSGTLTVLQPADGTCVTETTFAVMNARNGQCYASPAAAGGLLYLCSDNGITLVVTATDTPTVVAENTLERTRASPVFDGDRLYIRGMQHLYCIAEPR